MKFTTKELDKIGHGKSNSLSEMLREWVSWYPGDSRESTDVPSNTGIQNALAKAGLYIGEVIQCLTPYQDLQS